MKKELNGELLDYKKVEETKVDGLTPSKYLLELANENINGKISSNDGKVFKKYWI